MDDVEQIKRGKALIREYLYIDQMRINSYLDQVSSTTIHDKAPSLEVGLSLIGPSVKAGQVPRYRDKTDHEKICELIEHLGHYGHLGHSRPSLIHTDHDDMRAPDFVLEECDATRVLIPAVEGTESKDGVVIWLSEWPLQHEKNALRPAGLLCVIQGSALDDKRSRAGFSHSGYTWLGSLLCQLRQQSRETQLTAKYPLSPTGDYLYDLIQAEQLLQNEMTILRPNPLGWLKANGCVVLSLKRRIMALYKIRHVGIDQIGTERADKDFTISTFAYGIAIWAGPNKAI